MIEHLFDDINIDDIINLIDILEDEQYIYDYINMGYCALLSKK